MKTVINISSYEGLQDLEMIQYEVNAYVNVLEHLLNRKVSVQDEHYQYYEKKYIHNFFILNKEKEKFVNYLFSILPEDKFNLHQNFNWDINFDTKEVTIYEQ